MSQTTGFTDPDAGRAVARYLGVTLREVSDLGADQVVTTGEVGRDTHLRAPAGHVRAGVLIALVDTVGGICGGLAALPGWVVSTNLLLRTATFEHRGPLRLVARVQRVGRNSVVTAVEVTDDGAAGALVADGILTSAVLQPAGGPPVYRRPMVLLAPDPGTDLPGPVEFFGIAPRDAHSVGLEITDVVRNPWGILHGGVTAALVDAAAEHIVGPGASAADVALHFLRPGRIGPVVARADRLGMRPDGHLVRVEVVDTGAQDRIMAVAVVTVRGA